jgi:amino acid adenylation domain-containing protein
MKPGASEVLIFDEILVEEKEYWMNRLSAKYEPASLRPDYPLAHTQTAEFSTIEFKLNLDSYSQVRGITHGKPFLIYTTLMAVLKVCLYKYTSSKTIVVGSPARDDGSYELMQPNALPILSELNDDMSFRQLLLRVRQSLLDAYKRQRYPYSRMLKDAGYDHEGVPYSLFQVVLAMKELHSDLLEVNNDLTLIFCKEANHLRATIKFNSEAFEQSSIERFWAHMENVLRAGLGDTNRAIGDISMLCDSERHQLLYEWNDTESIYETDDTVVAMFERQAEANTDKVAVVDDEEAISYGELNREANRLANYLRDRGVKQECRVGISVERGVWAIVGMLGIMKAGGAYVPLDASYPEQRLRYMLDDSRAGVLLTEQRLLDALPETEAQIVCLDRGRGLLDGYEDNNPVAETTADSIAYVVYTSGSTGKPKGIAIPHRAINRLVSNTNYISLEPSDRVAQVSNASFDAATFEIWGALLRGSTLVKLNKDIILSPTALKVELRKRSITTLFLTTALFNHIASEDPSAFKTVKHLLFGGEASDARRIKAALDSGDGPERLVHVYGPTESTTFATWKLVEDVEDRSSTVPIGKPISNTTLYSLDGKLEPLPTGARGELYIGGDGLACCYLNRPDLTAEKFIPDPFNDKAGARLYKTGDFACYLPDGNIDFVGRVDFQVKVRGFRIELEEIEAVLSQHAAVNQAVVTSKDSSGDSRIYAYIVPAESTKPAVSELHQYAVERLPDYMVPAGFVMMERMPLTPNGKIDRNALPEPELARADLIHHYVAPRTLVEEVLTGIWSDVLKIEPIGMLDTFFELGGRSLLATQVISRVRDTFKIEVPLRALFESPTIAELGEVVETEMRTGQGLIAPPITRSQGESESPLSFAQKRLWIINQLEPDSPAYNMPSALRLTGMLNIASFHQSISELIRRHESLRTTFSDIQGEPAQIIHAAFPLSISLIDLRRIASAQQSAVVRELAGREAQRLFDLSTGPLLRVSLLILGDEDYVVLFTMHHIISDGWSMGILVREVMALYEAYTSGNASPLPELEIQYSDFAKWQRDWLKGEILDNQLGYWKEQLAGAPPILDLPADRPRPSLKTIQGSVEPLALSEELSAALKALSMSEGATLFMTLLAGFQTLLYRYTGQPDILVGTPIAGRNRLEVERLIGFFVNSLVIRTDLSGNATFGQVLRRVREKVLEAYTHQELPFELLVEELQPERSLSHSPIFQVMFALQSAPEQELKVAGLKLDGLDADIDAAKFDMTFALQEVGNRIEGALEYNTDLFDPTTIKRMLQHFEALLENVTAHPLELVMSFDLLGDSERQQILIEYNDVPASSPSGKSLQEIFEQHVERQPEAIAVVFEDEQVTYIELNRRANQLARHLLAVGVEPEAAVGFCLDKSIEMIVAMLAILKAGGAYLPLDPAYPRGRLHFMIEDSEAAVVLTQERLKDHLPESLSRPVYLDSEWPQVAQHSYDNLTATISGHNAAYIIYTSGSTGIPKGVYVPHKAVERLIINTNYIDITSADVLTHVLTASFDGSTFEIWGALLCGAKLEVISKETSIFPSEFAKTIKERAVTVMLFTTSLFNEIAREQSKTLSNVSNVLFGGDKADAKAVWEVMQHKGRARLVNVYGPTENCVFTTVEIIESLDEALRTVPIGRPISNTRAYALDAALNPVPIGVVGELFTSGEGLARGYVNRPDVTAEKFIPDPFDNLGGGKLYKTGDMVRVTREGKIEFLGRADNQVKLRGFRIEIGEIEAALLAQSGVRDAAVVLQQMAEGDKRLIAFVVAEGHQAERWVNELQRELKQRLPDHMVPSAILLLDEMPMTPAGKVDRRGLLEIKAVARAEGEQYIAPRSQTEQVLAAVWEDVLAVERVGVNDNFFDRGGHSLLATKVLSRVRKAFQVEITLRTLFESLTLGLLAEQIDIAMSQGIEAMLPPIVPATRDLPLPMSYGQQRLWFIDQLVPGTSAYNLPVAVRLEGTLNIAALQQSFSEIIRRHEVLRTVFKTVAGRPSQVINPPRALILPIIDLSGLPEDKREAAALRLVAAESQRPFQLAHGPLLRIRLFRLKGEDHLALVNMHHIISDGWSLGIFTAEIVELYKAFTSGEASRLDELSIQYADFTVWQTRWFEGEALEEQMAYWKRQLEGLSPMELPTDRPRPITKTINGGHLSARFSGELSDRLNQLSRRENSTLFITMLSLFKTLLYQYSGQDDIAVGVPIAGRNRVEIEPLIGFFVNTLVLRTDLSGEPSFRELINRVREAALGAYRHQDLPFEKLVQELQPEQDLSRTPLFQIMFVLQNASQETLELPGLQLSPFEADIEAVKFDMTLNITEDQWGLTASVAYNTDLFDEVTMSRMLEHMRHLLGQAVLDPDRRVSEILPLSETEHHQILTEWNDTQSDYPYDATVIELFEAQARRSPDAIAIAFADERLTFRALDIRANQLASYLRLKGVCEETMVGLCAERSINMVVAMLAILKAGGAYLPLDPAYPKERLSFMLKDSKVTALVTQAGLLEDLSGDFTQVVYLDKNREEISSHAHSPVARMVKPDNLAYVIYTSGSTGQPKGVLVQHSGLTNLVQAQARAFNVTPESRVLQFASLSFDASVSEVFVTLVSGATLCLTAKESLLPGQGLIDLLREQAITAVTLPPPLLAALNYASLPQLSSIIVAGEAISSEVVDPWINGRKVINGYGPTEATVCATIAESLKGSQKPPIGRPISNVNVRLLNKRLRPVAVGVPGEVCVSGVGLARGYWNRPELTAEKFMPDPFGAKPGSRMYRTGDLARYLPDGNIDFLGRIDHQVKVRGYRIELGEVESALLQHPLVKEAVVTAREDAQGDKRLVAYIVAEGDSSAVTASLRSFLATKLPEYLLPSVFVALEALPLSPNGKVDRKSLPPPDGLRREMEKPFVAPRTAVEEMLSKLWAEILGLEKVGIYDNFFELGGNSIKAAILINRLQEMLGEFIYVITLFESPTVAGLSDYLHQNFPQAIPRLFGVSASVPAVMRPVAKINAAKVTHLRRLIATPYDEVETADEKNPQAIFVLSPPRSGSTLMRVVLGGHPKLFAPPELELLSFNTLKERRDTFAGPYSFWLEGTIRTLMQIKNCSAEEAKQIMKEAEDQDLSVKQFYRLMQDWIGPKTLVEKTPSYTLNLQALKRAEANFDNPLYIYLLRHPYGMINSFEEARTDEVFFRHDHPFTRRELAEMIWLICHQNILEFLKAIPANRQHRVMYEDLVKHPRPTVEAICDFIGQDFHTDMLEPYQDNHVRMTDSIHPLSKMLGDVKFHKHTKIDAGGADRWREQITVDFLGDISWDIAESLGYKKGLAVTEAREERSSRSAKSAGWSPLVAFRSSGSRPPFFCVHAVGGSVFCYTALMRHLDSDQPFYGLQARGMIAGQPAHGDIEAMASYYLDAMRMVEPVGPYYLGGWSMGGVIAFEIARQLQAQGEDVRLLAMFDSVVPSRMSVDERPESLLTSFALDMGISPEGSAQSWDVLGELEPAEQLMFILAQAKMFNLVPPDTSYAQFRRLFNIFKTNIQAAHRYVPQTYSGKLTIFTAEDQPHQTKAKGIRNLLSRASPFKRGGKDSQLSEGSDQGWSPFALQGVVRHTIPGNHFTIMREPNVKFLAERLTSCIKELEG